MAPRYPVRMFDSPHIDDLADFVDGLTHQLPRGGRGRAPAGGGRVRAGRPGAAVRVAARRKFLVRDGAVVAWVAPEAVTDDAGFRIVGTHTDSPGFKVKPGPLPQSAGWTGVGVEVYGGPLLNSWLDRDLGVAGRIVTLDGAVHLVRSGPIARIPQLAIHLDRTANEALKLDRQAHTQPILAVELRGSLLEHLCELADIRASQVAFHDLFAYDTQPPAVIGLEREFLASARLDNLLSTHAALAAIEGLAASGGPRPRARGRPATSSSSRPSTTRRSAPTPLQGRAGRCCRTSSSASPPDTG